ncbi:hypothetical protein [Nocardia asiatica]|uniref:hypothetical protein n=1 Tax=Nocardia asiatica TaxID=209252 RepID=UPI0002E6ABD7|nr:hypothetical protein [Nocardia asiatica]
MSINYGMDGVRFPQPVKVDSRVRGHGAVTSVAAVPGGLQATVRMTVEIDGSDRPACVADVLIRVLPDDASNQPPAHLLAEKVVDTPDRDEDVYDPATASEVYQRVFDGDRTFTAPLFAWHPDNQ